MFGSNNFSLWLQSTLIVPDASDSNRYFLFVTDPNTFLQDTFGILYTIIDVRLNGGKGDMLFPLRSFAYRPKFFFSTLYSTMHSNGKDVWLLSNCIPLKTTYEDTGAVYAFLLSHKGYIDTIPVISKLGNRWSESLGFGICGIDRKGEQVLTLSAKGNNTVVLAFNTTTGKISTEQHLVFKQTKFPTLNAWESTPTFSNDGKWIYYSGTISYRPSGGPNQDRFYCLRQYIGVRNKDSIEQSTQLLRDTLFSNTGYALNGNGIGPFSLAPDGKLYFPHYYLIGNKRYGYLGCVSQPDAPDATCGFNAFQYSTFSSSGYMFNYVHNYRLPFWGDFTVNGTCAGTPFNFTATANRTPEAYYWHFGEEEGSTSIQPNPSFVYQKAGNYKVTLVLNRRGRSDTVVKYVNVVATAAAEQLKDVHLCEGQSATVSLQQAAKLIKWSTGDTTRTLQVSSPGVYWVETTNAAGCTAKDSFTVTASPNPVICCLTDTAHCFNEQGSLLYSNIQPQNGVFYEWNNSGIQNKDISIYKSGVYTVKATHALSGCSSSDSFSVAEFCNYSFFVPTAFSPGEGDTLNALFKPVCNEVLQLRFIVYNRWGEVVFETNDCNKGWNGTVRGTACPEGVYAWYAELTGRYEDRRKITTLKGTVYLMR